ncbi:MAG TPA: HlyD family type I secretion periplasmic adaptor subunit [Hyphomicrobiaceae bacterium]|mgnify:CR=1 FL=1|nr:HlyD family type I secretion periplasmic adaptor subunit [Hyphomicrobiaceae bacterium]
MLDTESTLRRQIRLALLSGGLFGVGFFAWGALYPLEGAVAARAMVILENNVKKVQHPTGGIIGQMNVFEGKRVSEGEMLLRLDETMMRANLAIVVNDMVAQQARLARSVAERDGSRLVIFPDELQSRALGDPDMRAVLENELKLFENRYRGRTGQKAQLTERVGQLRREIEGLTEQRASVQQQLDVANREIADLRGLQQKGLVQRPRITSLERELARNQGILGDLNARMAGSAGKIAETELQIAQIDREAETEATKEIRDAETRLSELNEKRLAAEDQLRRIEIKAPISGIVQQLAVHTVGGVVSPSEPLMVIVPDSDQLIVEARLAPQDRDQITVEQSTRVRFSTFNQRTTPEVKATVFRISGDVIKDAQSGQYFYSVGVRVPPEEIARLNGAKLVPGMPAETFFRTDGRTLLSYLLKPLTDHWQHAFSGR